jgi:hypothetical protein
MIYFSSKYVNYSVMDVLYLRNNEMYVFVSNESNLFPIEAIFTRRKYWILITLESKDGNSQQLCRVNQSLCQEL